MGNQVPTQYALPEPYRADPNGAPAVYREQAEGFGVMGELVNLIDDRHHQTFGLRNPDSFSAETKNIARVLLDLLHSAIARNEEIAAGGGVAFPMPDVLFNAVWELLTLYELM